MGATILFVLGVLESGGVFMIAEVGGSDGKGTDEASLVTGDVTFLIWFERRGWM